MSKSLAVMKKIKNNYCLYLCANIYEFGLQLNLLKENIFEAYPNLNIKFAIKKEIIEKFNMDQSLFLDVDKIDDFRDMFGRCEELKCHPKINPVEQYCIENKINLCVSKEKPASNGVHIIVFNKGNGYSKDLGLQEMDKIKRIFGKNIKENPENFTENSNAKFVIGTSNWQIFYSAFKKIPTFLISNNEEISLFEKMFPLQKKIAL